MDFIIILLIILIIQIERMRKKINDLEKIINATTDASVLAKIMNTPDEKILYQRFISEDGSREQLDDDEKMKLFRAWVTENT